MATKHRFVYLLEVIFPTDEPDKEFMDELEKTAYLKGIKTEVQDEYYRDDIKEEQK